MFPIVCFPAFDSRPRWPSGKVSTPGPEGRSSKPDSTENPPCMGPAARKIIRSSQTPSRRCGAEAWRGGASSGVSSLAVQNYEAYP
ncbi:hypothetical protein AVEN_76828-1 [Araneus ventricosus]|uniref:Uncharacterized protein n=1 Tax=Araneus ventricosus TaxID=182803 RepID=A0A4Y2NF15_ARAVE|nr:hypothetical protein AVEN_76828-1 [Araneus ventricosus]